VRPAETRAAHPELPLVAGEGADQAAAEALALLRAAGPLGSRVRGLVRISQRRWDLVLDRGQRIQLPQKQPVQALERVLLMHKAQDLLERDLALVDMRLADRPTIRMSEAAVDEWWRVRNAALGD
jgi:cell division protein FtsQ